MTLWKRGSFRLFKKLGLSESRGEDGSIGRASRREPVHRGRKTFMMAAASPQKDLGRGDESDVP